MTMFQMTLRGGVSVLLYGQPRFFETHVGKCDLELALRLRREHCARRIVVPRQLGQAAGCYPYTWHPLLETLTRYEPFIKRQFA